MITKAFIELINGRTYTVQAEIEKTRLGYKITFPDGSGAEIRSEMIKKIETERKCEQIDIAGEMSPRIMRQDVPHYNAI